MSALRARVLLREAIGLMLREAGEEAEAFRPPFNQFTLWPADVKRVPYAKEEGVGPGERRLAKLMGGKVMGGGVSFDLDTPFGKFEVKEPTGNLYGEVRAETEGIAALEANLARIKNVAKRIDSVFGSKTRSATAKAAQDLYPPDVYRQIVAFASEPDKRGQTDVEWIMRGEIGMARMAKLAEVLRLIASGLKGEVVKEEKYVELGDTDSGAHVRAGDVAVNDFVKAARVLNIDPAELKVSQADVLKSTLSGAAFTNPDRFVSSVMTGAVKPSQVFHQTDGLVFVRPEGFIIVPTRDLDSRVTFSRISKGKPYFKLKRGGEASQQS